MVPLLRLEELEMEVLFVFLVLALLGGIVSMVILVPVALVRLHFTLRRLQSLEQRVMSLETHCTGQVREQVPVPPQSATAPASAPPPPSRAHGCVPAVAPAGCGSVPAPPPKSAVQCSGATPPPGPPASPSSDGFWHFGRHFEATLGQKWLVWVGMVFVLAGGGLFLKYMYDNNWVGPAGRVAIGAIAASIALVLGEHFRRKDWRVLFATLTGGGLGGYYLCLFYSFQVYGAALQPVLFALALCVTAASVALALLHNAPSVVFVGLIGGFLSPVLLSTGENQPHVLFTYIALLNLAAMGSAIHRRWPGVQTLAFLGTTLLYQGWYMKFYSQGTNGVSDQMLPALLYASLFYLMFLLIPTLHGLVRRVPATVEAVLLVAVNAVHWAYVYCQVLFEVNRQALGFVVLVQALLVFVLFQAWSRRLPTAKRDPMGEALLVTAMALVTLAIPIQLRLSVVPMAWAVQALVFAFLGLRFRRPLVQAASMAAIALSAGGLIYELPLHGVRFLPVFNTAFGTWLFVVACCAVMAWLYRKESAGEAQEMLSAVTAVLGTGLLALLLSLEVVDYWRVNRSLTEYRAHMMSSLIVLWSAAPFLIAAAWRPTRRLKWPAVPMLAYGIGCLLFLSGFAHYGRASGWLVLNPVFLSRLAFILALWGGGAVARRRGWCGASGPLALAAHGLLVFLTLHEFSRWGRATEIVDDRLAMSLVSGAWAFHALALIYLGLAMRNRSRRFMGFALFALTIGKVCFYDLGTLDRVYQIVSFLGSGLLLLVAGYFYQVYSSRVLGEPGTPGGEAHR